MITRFRDGRVAVLLDRRERILLYLDEQPMPDGRYDSRGYQRTIEAIAEATGIPPSSTYGILREMEDAGEVIKLAEMYHGQVRTRTRYVTRALMYALTRAGELLVEDLRRRSA